jgi:hypothetical protein
MRQPKSNEGVQRSPAAGPSAGGAALDAPTIGPFVASMEAIEETAAAPARWPSVFAKIAESAETVRPAPTRRRDSDHAAVHDADH